MLSGHISLFVVVSLAAAIFMFYYFSKTTKAQRLTRYGIVLTFAGLVGNLTDRLYFGYVRDFIDFIIFGYDFPIFNIADMAVVIGVGLIILEIILRIILMEKRKLEINEENVRLDKFIMNQFLIYQEHLFKNILKKGMFL